LEEEVPDFILQQDGAPPHWNKHVCDHLNEHLPQCWIGRAGPNDVPLMFWPPRSPDLTPCDFFFWGYVNGKVFIPPLPQDLQQLRQWIRDAVDSIDQDLLARVWQELDYHVDVCRVTGCPYRTSVNVRRNLESFSFMLYLYLWNKFITAVTAMFSFCTIHSELPCITPMLNYQE
jgi:hypothetical protein